MFALTLTTGILLPIVALATVVLLPFSDRLTQLYLLLTYFGVTGTTVYLAGMLL